MPRVRCDDELIEEIDNYPFGEVGACLFLDVYEAPNEKSRVVGSLPKGTEVLIDSNKSNDDFFYVMTMSGIKGYCSNDYIFGRF